MYQNGLGLNSASLGFCPEFHATVKKRVSFTTLELEVLIQTLDGQHFKNESRAISPKRKYGLTGSGADDVHCLDAVAFHLQCRCLDDIVSFQGDKAWQPVNHADAWQLPGLITFLACNSDQEAGYLVLPI